MFGKYSIDANGDITLTPYGVYKIEDGALVFDHTVEPGGLTERRISGWFLRRFRGTSR